MPEDQPLRHPPGPRGFAARIGTILLISSLFVLLLLTLWKSAQVLLLLFAGALLAVILRTASNGLSRWTRLSSRWSLTVVLILGFALVGTTGWIAAPKVAEQFQQLRASMDESVGSLFDGVRKLPGGESMIAQASEATEEAAVGTDLLRRARGMFTSTFAAVGGVLLFLFIGIFLAYDPRLYLAGILRLVPLEKRPRAREVFEALGHTLQGWLLGQLISMAFLFATTWIMLELLGVPLAFILALLTGMVTFVPYIGPLIALIPILLVAFVADPMLAVYTGLLYMVIQNVEGNVLMPLVFQRTVHLPAALSIAGQLILGGIFGALGFILATPLTAVVMVLVQKLYVEDVLGDSMTDELDETPKLPGAP